MKRINFTIYYKSVYVQKGRFHSKYESFAIKS